MENRRPLSGEQYQEMARVKAQARKSGRIVHDDWVPPRVNDAFSFLAREGLGQIAFTVARREAHVLDIDDVSEFWWGLLQDIVVGTSQRLDEGSLNYFDGASLVEGLCFVFRDDYGDIQEQSLINLAHTVAGMCCGQFLFLGYDVVDDGDRLFTVHSPKAA